MPDEHRDVEAQFDDFLLTEMQVQANEIRMKWSRAIFCPNSIAAFSRSVNSGLP